MGMVLKIVFLCDSQTASKKPKS